MKKTAHEIAYHSFVAGLDCMACGSSGVHVHHITNFGQGRISRSHFLVLPLCPSCHQGKGGIHDDPGTFRMRYGSEIQLLARLNEIIWRETRNT